jgi:hypothetical protein
LKTNELQTFNAIDMLQQSGVDELDFHLLKCIPSGLPGQKGGIALFLPRQALANPYLGKTWLVDDVSSAINKYIEFASRQDETGKRQWMKARISSVTWQLQEAKYVQDWCNAREKARFELLRDHRYQKKQFFEDRARAMTPSLSAYNLEKCPSYKKAMRISAIPTEETWRVLEPKLVTERQD